MKPKPQQSCRDVARGILQGALTPEEEVLFEPYEDAVACAFGQRETVDREEIASFLVGHIRVHDLEDFVDLSRLGVKNTSWAGHQIRAVVETNLAQGKPAIVDWLDPNTYLNLKQVIKDLGYAVAEQTPLQGGYRLQLERRAPAQSASSPQ